MLDITVLFLNQSFSSTAIGPMEVFRHAGSLWNMLTGTKPKPAFEVTTASANGKAVLCDGPLHLKPMGALRDVRKTGLIFVRPTGLGIAEVAERNAAVVPWVKSWQKRW